MDPQSSPQGSPRGSISAPADQAAQAQLQQMRLEMQNMYAAMQLQLQQQAQAAVAAAQQAAPVAHAQAARAPELPKIKSPSTFSGAMGFTVDDWLREQKQQFSYYGAAKFPDDASKIRFAVAHFAGAATMWWEHQPACVSWAEFEQRLHDRFRPVHSAMLARQRLGKLRQRAGQSVNQYVGAFQNTLTPITDMGHTDQVHHFTNGLVPAIASKVWEKHPTTLVEAIDAAVSIEAMYNFGRAAAPHGSRPYHGSSASAPGADAMDLSMLEVPEFGHGGLDDEPTAAAAAAAASHTPAILAMLEKMDARLNALSAATRQSKPFGGARSGTASTAKVAGLDAAEIKKLMSEGKCFRCKQPGHMKNDLTCPKHPSKNA